MRSYVCDPMQHGRLHLAGDMAHTVRHTEAKGLDLAVADVVVLSRAIEQYYACGDTSGLDRYSKTAFQRVWRVQHLSWWMTSMLHRAQDQTDFDLPRQRATGPGV